MRLTQRADRPIACVIDASGELGPPLARAGPFSSDANPKDELSCLVVEWHTIGAGTQDRRLDPGHVPLDPEYTELVRCR